MILEPFFAVTWGLAAVGYLLSGYVFYLGWAITVLMVAVNLKMIFIPAIRNYFVMINNSVEAETFKYYENATLHRNYDHPVAKAFAGPKVDWVHSKLDLTGKSVLDVGGGNGYFSYHLMKVCKATHVLDISPEQLKMNPLPEKQCHLGTAYKLEFPDNSFDIVMATNLLHHLDQPEVAMKEMERVAKSYVVIVDASNFNPIFRLSTLLARHEFRSGFHSKAVVQKLITDQGLEVQDHCYQGGMMYPNRSPEWCLPYCMYNTFNKYMSYFQIFISKKSKGKNQ